MTLVGTIVFIIGILGLFALDRDPKVRTSKALWLPVLWLLIIASRPVSAWLQGGGPAQDIGFEDGSPLDRNIFLVLIVFAVAVLFQRGAAVGRILRGNWPLLLFIVYCAVSIAWSDYPEVSARRWVKSVGDVAMVLIVLTDVDRKNAIKAVMARVGFILLPWSILLIKYYPDYGRAYSKWEGKAFYVGVAADKNMLGMTCMIFGLGAAWRVIHELRGERRTKTLIVHGTIVAMALWLITTANSMTSLSCFIFGAALILVTSSRRLARTPTRVHIMVAIVLLASSSVLFLNVGGNVLSAMGRNPTLTGRTDLWEALLKMDRSPLLGAGFENFWSPSRVDELVAALQWAPNEAHNGYLEVYLNLGWIGVLLLGAVLVAGYRNVFQALRYDTEMGRLKLAFLVIGIAYSFTEAGFRMMTPVWIAFLWAVIAVPSALGRPATLAVRREIRKNEVPALAEQEPAISK